MITTVVLTGTARAGDVDAFSRGAISLRDQSSVAGDVTLDGAFARFTLEDDAVLEGTLTAVFAGPFSSGSFVNLEGGGSVGNVNAGIETRVTLDDNVTVQGDFVTFGDVELNGGRILGSATLDRFDPDQEASTEFLGDLTLRSAAYLRSTDKQFGGNVTVEDIAKVEIRGASEVSGVLRVKDQAQVMLFVSSAAVPAGFIQDSVGVFSARDSNGNQIVYSYEREPGASILVVRADDPASITVCTQSSPNSTGVASHVEALGSNDATSSQLTLRATDLSNSFAFFFVGTESLAVSTFSGLLCVNGYIGRFDGPGQILISGSLGSITITFDTTMIPGNPPTAATPGSTYYFQCWHRDFFSGTPASRFSDTAAVTFE